MKENEIRPDKFQDRIHELASQDKQYLIDRKDQFQPAACPACGSGQGTPAFEKFETLYQECQECRTIYASPRPGPDLLAEYYRQSKNYEFWAEHVFPASEETRRLKIFRPRVDLVASLVKKYDINPGTLLEIGAGFGTFAQEMSTLNLFQRIIAMELTPKLAQGCRDRGLEVMEMPVEEAARQGMSADVIVSFETIEHLFDPLTVLKACHHALEPGGLLGLTCPNMHGFETMMLGSASSSVGGEHLNMFNPDSVTRLLTRAGFEVMEITTPGKLDVDLVSKQFQNGILDRKNQAFLSELVAGPNRERAESFQNFLAQNKLSSHMMSVARKLA